MTAQQSSLPELTDGQLRLEEHQVAGIEWLRARERALLADEPGLGKTVQMLRSATEPVLAIAPAMVLESGTWSDEVERWEPDLDITTVSYSSLCVRGERGRVSRDANGFPIVEVKPEYRRHWGTVLCDESHYLKGRKTSWTAGVRKLSGEKLVLATGTPIPNWAPEAFTSLQLVYPADAKPGKRFGSYWRWAKEWFDVSDSLWNPVAMDVGDLRGDRTWEEFYAANWGDRLLRRLRADCLDLPPLTLQEWRVGMAPAQRKAYRELKRDFITWLDSGEAVEAWSSAAQLVKLMKAATGLEVLDPRTKGSAKLDTLAAVLTDRPLPTLVVAHFQSSVEACARTAERAGRTALTVHGGVSSRARTLAIRAFQRGELDVLCASIETISEGMTLHRGGADQVIRVERSARPSRNEQVLRRLHRMGVARPIIAIDLITEGTVDEAMLELLQAKTDQQMRALRPAELRSLGK